MLIFRFAALSLLMTLLGCDGPAVQSEHQPATGAETEAASVAPADSSATARPWFEQEPPPDSLSEVMQSELARLGQDNPGYRMLAGEELCSTMSRAGLPCDYNSRYALVQFLLANGKPLPSTTGWWSYTGQPVENQQLADAVARNLALFENDLTSAEVRDNWR